MERDRSRVQVFCVKLEGGIYEERGYTSKIKYQKDAG